MTTNQCDPRALLLAQELHQAEQPDITILFGSRARGDYREGQSDIDIMLQEQPPSPEQQASAEHTARRCAAAQYDQPTPVQIIWQTQAEFKKMRRTINHVVANALRDGITCPQSGRIRLRPQRRLRIRVDRYRRTYRHAENHIHDALIAAGADDTMPAQWSDLSQRSRISSSPRHQPAHPRRAGPTQASISTRRSMGDQCDQEYRPTGTPISNIEHYQNIVNSDQGSGQELRPPSSE